MSAPADEDRRRGSAAVGRIAELPALEATAVVTMRLWCAEPQRQAEVWNRFARTFGGRDGAARLKSFERLMCRIARCARRPMMCHDVACICVGADEAAFAKLIATAAHEEAHEAMLFAALLVRPEAVGHIAAQARLVGQSLRAICPQGGGERVADAAARHRFTHSLSETRH